MSQTIFSISDSNADFSPKKKMLAYFLLGYLPISYDSLYSEYKMNTNLLNKSLKREFSSKGMNFFAIVEINDYILAFL